MLTSLLDRVPLLKGLLDFIYPPICAGCGAYFEDERGICSECADRIDWFDEVVGLTDVDFRPGSIADSAGTDSFPLFAAGGYSDPLERIIIQYKFRGVTGPVVLVAQQLVEQFGEKILKLAPAVLIPIPLHPSREYVRGYNQAALFAKELASRLEMPVDENLIRRVKKRKPQSRLKKSQRSANIKSVFSLTTDTIDDGAVNRLILVDDVITSGQTMFEARRVLIKGGYEVVGAITMAHAT